MEKTLIEKAQQHMAAKTENKQYTITNIMAVEPVGNDFVIHFEGRMNNTGRISHAEALRVIKATKHNAFQKRSFIRFINSNN